MNHDDKCENSRGWVGFPCECDKLFPVNVISEEQKQINEFLKEINSSDGIIKDFAMWIYFSIYRFWRWIRRIPYNFRWAYQRARYGYSDRDWWSGDYHIAGVIAGIMEKIVKDGNGVAMSYWNEQDGDPWNPDVDLMVERRDEEWNKYIAIFREYSKNGPAINQEWKDEFGGVLDSDMKDALLWLSEHFSELWD